MMLTLSEYDIPRRLKDIENPPSKLFINGKLPDLKGRLTLAVVGTRRMSPYGRFVTEKLVRELAEVGVIIVSGLALGVDSLAHRVCLAAHGVTIAVLPGGINKVYPRSHEPLAQEIIKNGGCVLSEYNGDYTPHPHDFLIRNRIISGLSDGVLVTEAALRSGSLNTARHALEQGRSVFAVPGNITSDLSSGTNNLIKMGATPVSVVDDILRQFNLTSSSKPVNNLPQSPEEKIILDLIKQGINNGDELLLRSGLRSSQFTEAMTMLEIAGTIHPLGANKWDAS